MNRTYVLRSGRMTDAQRRSYETLLPQYSVPFEEKTLDFSRVFRNNNPTIIEIGFGMGIATAQIAEENPHINYLGIEVHKPGVGKLAGEIERRQLRNIRIIEHDAVEVVETMVNAGSVDGFHIFFPDPWRKKRHHKRRLIQKPFTSELAAKLKPDGYVYMVTDWAEYGDWALAELSATPALINAYPSGFAEPQPWRPRTKFEEKGLLQNREIRELFFKKETRFTSA
ncbi:MAG: tRNA (guanosine(46)-N7)-methyltransferase TrmB [Treponema sp.]|jgi:tRNA (guanine-N7-)-methyltransferase|nr:tRNA (guanosine(46)-N7)-methyltransferase TrmB [Treponema sp.]